MGTSRHRSLSPRWSGFFGALFLLVLGLTAPAAAGVHAPAPASRPVVDAHETSLRPDGFPGDHSYLESRTAELAAVSERQSPDRSGRDAAAGATPGVRDGARGVPPAPTAEGAPRAPSEWSSSRRIAWLQVYRC